MSVSFLTVHRTHSSQQRCGECTAIRSPMMLLWVPPRHWITNVINAVKMLGIYLCSGYMCGFATILWHISEQMGLLKKKKSSVRVYFSCWLDCKKSGPLRPTTWNTITCSYCIISILLKFLGLLYNQWCLWVRCEFFCRLLLLQTIRPGALEESGTFSAGIPAQNASCCNGSSSRSSDEREYVSSSPRLPAHDLPPTYSVMSQSRLLKENMILLHNPEIKFTEH